MSIDLDGIDFDYERSRAAVAVACLQWLRCTGPAIGPGVAREIPPEVAESAPIEGAIPDPYFSPHPLWDRWLDG
jgi:hypothetical protein